MPHRFAAEDPRSARFDRVATASAHLADTLHRVPWLVIACTEGYSREAATFYEQAAVWGSIGPAIWSFALAARARGLGTVLTTRHLHDERAVAEILDIPYPEVSQCALLPVAFTIGTDFRPAVRLPVEQVTHWDSW
jgi:nitroreductase